MRVNTQPGAFVFQAGLTAPPGSLHYDAAPDADGNGDPLGGRGGLPAQNPTSQTWDAKRMAEERQRLELEAMKQQLERLEERLEEPLRRMAWQQHRDRLFACP